MRLWETIAVGVEKVSEIFGRLRYSWLVSRLIEEEEECCLVEHLGGISVSVHG